MQKKGMGRAIPCSCRVSLAIGGCGGRLGQNQRVSQPGTWKPPSLGLRLPAHSVPRRCLLCTLFSRLRIPKYLSVPRGRRIAAEFLLRSECVGPFSRHARSRGVDSGVCICSFRHDRDTELFWIEQPSSRGSHTSHSRSDGLDGWSHTSCSTTSRCPGRRAVLADGSSAEP